jgi:hypothetical protein
MKISYLAHGLEIYLKNLALSVRTSLNACSSEDISNAPKLMEKLKRRNE